MKYTSIEAGQMIIASRNDSHTSLLIDGMNGLLANPENTGELAGRMLQVINDRKLRSRLSKSARHLCEKKFSNAVVSGRLEELYLKVIAKDDLLDQWRLRRQRTTVRVGTIMSSSGNLL